MIEILTVDTPALGDRSYLATDGSVALVVDPQRDTGRMLELAAEHGAAITHVFETHIHNDYVTGGLALAGQTGATYHVNGDDSVAFDRKPISDGDVIDVGDTMRVRVMATPGHTFTHLSYALEDVSTGTIAAVFTGGSLLYGSTGRPDLLGAGHKDALAAAQHASAHRLAAELPDETPVWPTHGFGSFCSATQAEGNVSTIGHEKRVNPVLVLDQEEYVAQLLAGLDAYPAYYAHMGPANSAGPGAPDLTPPEQADAAELETRIAAGEWVVDLRNRRAFAAGHVAGTFAFEYGDSFTNYLGWLIPWGMPLTLLGDTPEQVANAQRDLARIGIDKLAAQAAGTPEQWADGRPLASFEMSDFAGLATVRHHRPVTVLDVRRALEWGERHIDGAVHIPLQDLLARIDEVPQDKEIWVHCRSGYRAAVAASLLDATGRTVVAIDDNFDNAAAAGLPTAEAVEVHA